MRAVLQNFMFVCTARCSCALDCDIGTACLNQWLRFTAGCLPKNGAGLTELPVFLLSSSPEYKVPRVTYCDQPLSVVVRRPTCVNVLAHLSTKLLQVSDPGPFGPSCILKHLLF